MACIQEAGGFFPWLRLLFTPKSTRAKNNVQTSHGASAAPTKENIARRTTAPITIATTHNTIQTDDIRNLSLTCAPVVRTDPDLHIDIEFDAEGETRVIDAMIEKADIMASMVATYSPLIADIFSGKACAIPIQDTADANIQAQKIARVLSKHYMQCAIEDDRIVIKSLGIRGDTVSTDTFDSCSGAFASFSMKRGITVYKIRENIWAHLRSIRSYYLQMRNLAYTLKAQGIREFEFVCADKIDREYFEHKLIKGQWRFRVHMNTADTSSTASNLISLHTFDPDNCTIQLPSDYYCVIALKLT